MDDTSHPAPQPHSQPGPSGHATGSSPGILVFTTALQLLYMNGEARVLCGHVNAQLLGHVADGVVPREVLELCEELVALFATRTGAKDWDQFQLTRAAGGPSCAVQLRGLGLPDPGGLAQSRLLILIEETDRPYTATAQRAKDRFRLTDREQTVVIYLVKGLTNKEIAGRMMVEEQTVKEHLRHIMEKTGTTTRTGLLSKIVLTDPVPGPHAHASPRGPA